MILTLKITLARGLHSNGAWSANVKLDESANLEVLHDVIQQAVDFDNDHLYCFYFSRTYRSRDRKHFDDQNGLILSAAVNELFPPPARKSLFYLFDWGDEWIFKISQTRKRPHEPAKGVKYPHVESESGVKPTQYPSFADED